MKSGENAVSEGLSRAKVQQEQFALLLPVYRGDRADHFERALNSSTFGQTLMPAQVIIVQDGPLSPELHTRLERLREEASLLPYTLTHIVFPENRGLAEALNAGIAASEHEVIARMDADDLSFPTRFEKQWKLLARGYDLIGSAMLEFSQEQGTSREKNYQLNANDLVHENVLRLPPAGERIREHARTHTPFNHPTMMYRKSVIEKVGGYLPFGTMEDYWLAVRLLQAGARTENSLEPLLAYRVSEGAYHRRGGFAQFFTELALQTKLLRMRFITPVQFARNIVMKGVYRLLPARIRRALFRRFIAGGLKNDRS